jgi:hypothetical protein
MSSAHDVIIAQALAASDPGERRDILAAALQRYGPDLLASLLVAAAAEEAEMQLLVEAGELLADWIDAEQITGSAGEAERRLVAVDAMAALLTDDDPLAAAGAALARAEALLGLPVEHPYRDVAAAEALAEEARQLAHGAGHDEGHMCALLVLIGLPDQDLATFERRVRQGRALRTLRTHRRLFELRAAQLALSHATAAQQQGEASQPRSWLSLAGSLLAPLRRRWRANADLTEAERSVLSHYLYARGNLRESAELAHAGEAGLPAQLRAAEAWARQQKAREMLTKQPLELIRRFVRPPQLLVRQHVTKREHPRPLYKLVSRLRKVRSLTEVDHHLRAPMLAPASPRATQLMFSTRACICRRRAKTLPKDAHDNRHPLSAPIPRLSSSTTACTTPRSSATSPGDTNTTWTRCSIRGMPNPA